jgi:uncharacterized membrane protein YkvA (DUF1232 family)
MRERWRRLVRTIRTEVRVLALAARDPRVPWYAKAVAVGVLAYALSPIDLIPDFIPVLGLVDDVLLVPLGVVVARWLIPPAVLAECRERAQRPDDAMGRIGWLGAVGVIVVWLALLGWAVRRLR